MARLRLAKGAQYRVKYSRYRNPFAGLRGVKDTLPVLLDEPGVWTGWRIALNRGDVLVYRGSKTGVGSDPGFDELFEHADGRVGAFNPTRGPFGGVDAIYLQPLTEAIGALEGLHFRIVTAAEFDAARDKPKGLTERAASVRASSTFVIYDPEGDEHGFMVWGDDVEQLATDAAAELKTLNIL